MQRITITEPGQRPMPTTAPLAAVVLEPHVICGSPPPLTPISPPPFPTPAPTPGAPNKWAPQTLRESASDLVAEGAPRPPNTTSTNSFSSSRSAVEKNSGERVQETNAEAAETMGTLREARKTGPSPMHTIELLNLVMMVAGRIASSMQRKQKETGAESVAFKLPAPLPVSQKPANVAPVVHESGSSSSSNSERLYESTTSHSSTSSSSDGSNSIGFERPEGVDKEPDNKEGSRSVAALPPKFRWKRRALEEAEAAEAETAAQSASCPHTNKRIRS